MTIGSGHYAPALFAMLRAIKMMPGALRKHGARGANYLQLDRPLRAHVDTHDAALNLFLRAIHEFGSKTVIEIGAFDGARITALKRLVPSIDAWGLDILPTYQQPFVHAGVRFAFLDKQFFDSIKPPALVCSRATLYLLPPGEIGSFLRQLSERGLDLALYEPAAYRNVDRSLKRSPNSFYHPYDFLLRRAGMTPVADFESATRFSFALSMMESWYVNVARAKAAG